MTRAPQVASQGTVVRELGRGPDPERVFRTLAARQGVFFLDSAGREVGDSHLSPARTQGRSAGPSGDKWLSPIRPQDLPALQHSL